MEIFPSRVSGRGYGIGPVCLCACLSVWQSTRGKWWLTHWASLHRANLSWHLTSCDVTTWRHDVTWRLDIIWRPLGKNTDKEGTSQEGPSTLRRFHFIWNGFTRKISWNASSVPQIINSHPITMEGIFNEELYFVCTDFRSLPANMNAVPF